MALYLRRILRSIPVVVTQDERVAAAMATISSHGLEALDRYVNASTSLRVRCTTCGVVRLARVASLRNQGAVGCRWCHGWQQWGPWGETARERAASWRAIAGPDDVLERLHRERLAPLTAVGDEYTPVGFVCLCCGELGVTMPERIHHERPGWFGCPRCAQDRKAGVRVNAAALFEANGLKLSGQCRGEYVPQACTCTVCGSPRSVSYAELVVGTAPLCWTCTHGIRPDEPHRVYLVRFEGFGVLKVGLTHNRHDRRLAQHQLEGGIVVESIVVPDRAAARTLERWIIAYFAPWARPNSVGPAEFPQGGWTETWTEQGAPTLSLLAAAKLVGISATA